MKILLLVSIFILFFNIFASISIQDRLTNIFDVSIGEVINSSINIHNGSNEHVNIRITRADFIKNANDEIFYLEPGRYVRSNANWIRVPQVISIRPDQSVSLPYSIHVPNDNKLYGSYWSIIIIEEEPNRNDIVGHALSISVRYIIQIITNIYGTGTLDLRFRELTFSNDYVSFIITNTGSLWFDTNVKIDIVDDRAEFIGSFTSKGNRVFPELETSVRIPVNLESNQVYHAIIIADCGNNNIFGHQVTFSIE